MQRFSATFRISVAITSLSVCVLVSAYVLKILPDRREQELQSSAALCESVAVSCAAAAAAEDTGQLRATLRLVGQRHPEVLSASIVNASGAQLVSVNPYDNPANAKGQVITVPLRAHDAAWGALHMKFRSPETGLVGILNSSTFQLVGFVGGLNCLVFFWYLRIVLQHLNPSKVIPPRVRSTLDTFAEGLLVLNQDRRIVLANEAFARTVGERPDDLQGRCIDQFPWQRHADEPEGNDYPWERALKLGEPQTGSTVSLRTSKDLKRTFMVNAAPVMSEEGCCHGVLASFDDVTEIQQRNAVLRQMLSKLQASREKIRKQNEELRLLATRDPLTGCLNRRAFFEVFERHFVESERSFKPLTCILLDVDLFKEVNDQHGHAVGDDVLNHVAHLIRRTIRDVDLLGRYGGEEFCIALPEQEIGAACVVAERIRQTIESDRVHDLSITASLGVSASDLGAETDHRLMQQADEALYAAKRSGRNRVCRWDKMPEQPGTNDVNGLGFDDQHTSRLNALAPINTVQTLLATLFFRDSAAAEHCRRVADFCEAVSHETLDTQTAYLLKVAALLHEIGRIGWPDTILFNGGLLTQDDQLMIESCDQMGSEILKNTFRCEELNRLLDCYRHRRKGKKSGVESIHLMNAVGLLELADRFDCLAYLPTGARLRSDPEALDLLQNEIGDGIDPELVARFVQSVIGMGDSRDPYAVCTDQAHTQEFEILEQLRQMVGMSDSNEWGRQLLTRRLGQIPVPDGDAGA